jgi:hypothetical protein
VARSSTDDLYGEIIFTGVPNGAAHCPQWLIANGKLTDR